MTTTDAHASVKAALNALNPRLEALINVIPTKEQARDLSDQIELTATIIVKWAGSLKLSKKERRAVFDLLSFFAETRNRLLPYAGHAEFDAPTMVH